MPNRFDLIRSIGVDSEGLIRDKRFPLFAGIPLRSVLSLYRESGFGYPRFVHTLFPQLPLDSIPHTATYDDLVAWCYCDPEITLRDLQSPKESHNA